jgi:peptide/nickel transport system substrate-binding protein
MNRSRPAARALLAVVALTLVAAACGRSASSGGGTTGQVDPTKGLVTTTPAGTTSVPAATWAVYRDVNSLDPIYAFDYPENTAISLMCESLLRQAPDGTIGPGLATLANPSPTSMVFTLKPGVTFWDGHPVTPADVVYSLERNTDTALGGFYSQVFDRVKSIEATGANQVTITLKQPDYWLEGELASMAGIVIEKAFAEQQGKKYGTPGGSIMCTGAYKLKSFNPGVGVTAVLNPSYWNTAVHPMVKQILIKGVPDASSLTSGLITGGLQGGFTFGLATLTQLQQNKNVTVYQGPGQSTDAFVVSNPKGILGNVAVRQALSDALNRQGIISSVYRGAALMPRWIANPGTFGYGKAVFTTAYDASPEMSQNLAAAKKLVAQAGATGKTFTIGTSNEISSIASVAGAYQAAAQAIGLKAKLKSVSANNYINFFTEAKARAGIDGFITVNYGDYADPAALLSTIVLPHASQNYSNYNNPQITSLLDQARGTADPNQRAHLVAQAEQLAAKSLPWIPDAQPTSVLILHKGLTGAVASFSYMFAPWADNLGGTG